MDWFLYDNSLRHEGVKQKKWTSVLRIIMHCIKNEVFR